MFPLSKRLVHMDEIYQLKKRMHALYQLIPYQLELEECTIYLFLASSVLNKMEGYLN